MNIFKRNFERWTRWLHIYLSMFSFATLLFFAITGITLNHTNWIEGRQKVEQVEGDLAVAWVHSDSLKVAELKVVEYMRNTYAIRSPLSDFTTDDSECSFSFKGPGYNADGFIDRSTGHFELTITKYGLIAILNDLHKGRDSGTAWAWFIDISAVLMILVSVTGFLMIFLLKKKRLNGLLIAGFGTILILLIYYLFV
jgi:uncharacterized protein